MAMINKAVMICDYCKEEIRNRWDNIGHEDFCSERCADFYEKSVRKLLGIKVEDITKVLTKQFDEIHRKKIEKIFEDIEEDLRSCTILSKTKDETQYAYSLEWLLKIKKKHLGDVNER